MQMLRESLGPDIDIAVDFHTKTSSSVASIRVKEIEPLNLRFIEDLCPPGNVQALARIARRSTTPIATSERLVGIFGVRAICKMGVVDILQTDINHVGGITGLWKVSQMAASSGVSMAPRACEGHRRSGPLQVNSAILNFVVQEICGQIQPGATDKIWAVAGISRYAHGGRALPAVAKARSGVRAYPGESGKVPLCRDAAHGARVSRRQIGSGVVVHFANRRH
jgi:galactonate dehydratase